MRPPQPSALNTRPAEVYSNAAQTAAQEMPFASATARSPARVMIVAEIGVNHDGNLQRAIHLVDAAALAGADAIKLQLFDPRSLLSNQALLADYQKGQAASAFALLDNLKLDVEQMLVVRAAARRRGLGFVVTPFSLENIPELEKLDVDAVKIASPDVVNQPLLEAAVELGRPMLISTGAAKLEELTFAARLLRQRRVPACLLQCISSYPTPMEEAGLGGIAAIAARFALPVGYSDHTTDLWTGALAVAAGACVIEKHLTYDRQAAGPDHAASFDPRSFSEYVRHIRQAARMMGPRGKSVHEVEADVRRVSRQSVCVKRDLPAGHMLGAEDLTIKRPGTGIAAARLREVIGCVLRRAVRGNSLLHDQDLLETDSGPGMGMPGY